MLLDRGHDQPPRRLARGGEPRRVRPRRRRRPGHGVRRGPRPEPLPGPGGGAARARHRQQCRPRDADRLRQEPGRAGRAHHRGGPGAAHLLHGPDQGPGQREVLRPVREVRRRARRHAHRRRLGQRRRPDHLLHRRDPGPAGAAGGRGSRRRAGGDGRVPLLRRPRPGLGVAGAAAGAAAGAVPADVGHPRRRHHDPRRPRATYGTRDGAGHRGGAAGAADLPLGADADARDARGAVDHPPGPRLRRALHPGLGAGAGPGAQLGQRRQPPAARRHRGGDRCVPLRPRLRQDLVAAAAARRRGAPRRHAAALPTAGGDPGPGRAAAGRLRHRHPRRRHQRADPHRRAERPDQVRRPPPAAAHRARVPPGRRSRRARRLRHRGHRRRAGTGPPRRQRQGDRQGR